MAKVRIPLARARNEGLPPVCMCCGASAALYKRQQFIWAPLSTYFLGPLGYSRYWRAWMDGPLCAAHRYHWTWRWVLPLCLLLVGMATAFGSFIYLDITRGSAVAHSWRGSIVGCGAVAFVLWYIFFKILRRTGVHPVRIDSNSITFAGVADAFAQAVENPIAVAGHGRETVPQQRAPERKGHGRETVPEPKGETVPEQGERRGRIAEVLPADEPDRPEWRRGGLR
ncbi:MAG TPA: hypothetical protein VKS79_14210 [Gemmataceae bacterium]|nr:hypothetical protein [Gemmataceae bacterium]